jgi:hypothetical protein
MYVGNDAIFALSHRVLSQKQQVGENIFLL